MPITGEVLVAHYREVGLKGRNRSFFERTLVNNMRRALQSIGGAYVENISGRLIVHTGNPGDLDAIASALQQVFGLSSISRGLEIRDADLDLVTEASLRLAGREHFESFRVRARRGNSSFPLGSQKVNEAVGRSIQDATGARVDLSGGQWTCHIELVTNRGYVYSTKLPAPGGLPVGSSGQVLALLSGGIDSPVAAWLMGKRGAAVDFIHFHGRPYSDGSSERQARRLARALSPWLLASRLWMVPFGDIQSEITTGTPTKLRIVLYRRFMMRIAEALALREGAEALVTGESLGQVASQTLPNMAVINRAAKQVPILRPLVGADKLEIEETARRIGTYEISIEPHQDCCVLFIPREVTTAASAAGVEEAESGLDVESLVDKALA
ncbi:MAG: tRNA uracil 4-sulfurtransferase ThiI, partial [Actinomycetota bacterium]